MGCCFCCLGEDALTAAVMESFTPTRVSQVKAGSVVKAVGYPVSMEGKGSILLNPIDGNPVLWYHIRIKEVEKWEEEYQTQDANGNQVTRRREQTRERDIFNSEKGCQFLLVDGKSSILVDTRNNAQSKISTNQARSEGEMPRGRLNEETAQFVKTYLRKDNRSYTFSDDSHKARISDAYRRRNGGHNFSYRWSMNFLSIKQGSKICVIGNAIEQNGQLTLQPVTENTKIDNESWNSTAKKAWEKEVKGQGALFVSNKDSGTAECAVDDSQIPQPQYQQPEDIPEAIPMQDQLINAGINMVKKIFS